MSEQQDNQTSPAIPDERLKEATSDKTTETIARTDKKTDADATNKIVSPDASVSSAATDEADGSRSGGVM